MNNFDGEFDDFEAWTDTDEDGEYWFEFDAFGESLVNCFDSVFDLCACCDGVRLSERIAYPYAG